MVKRRLPTRHLVNALTALYAPSTPAKRQEADRLAREHCARVERGVPLNPRAKSPQPELFEGEAGTSRRCPDSETTPAGEARCTGDAGAEGRGGLPLGDSPTHSDAA